MIMSYWFDAGSANSFVSFDGNGNSSASPAPWPRSIHSGSQPNTRMMRRTWLTTVTGITTRARERVPESSNWGRTAGEMGLELAPMVRKIRIEYARAG